MESFLKNLVQFQYKSFFFNLKYVLFEIGGTDNKSNDKNTNLEQSELRL